MSDRRNTREYWLQQAVIKLRPLFKDHDAELPESVFVSVGLPHRSTKAIGQCFKDKHVFISPVLSEPADVLATLVHELVHVVVGNKAKHGPAFGKVARAVGLEGKLTETHAGEELKALLVKISDSISFQYPHEALELTRTAALRPPAGGWIKFESVNDEDYILRLSPKAFENHGAPTDPWGDEMVVSAVRGRK